ncbi:MAG TPA: capsule assembly Wzi family protein, partial [Gemmatimonadales bacterium]
MTAGGPRIAGWLPGLLLAAGLVTPCGAQAPVIPGETPASVTPNLLPDHWVMDAVRRAEGMGLLKQAVPFRAALSLELAAELLQEAATTASRRDSVTARLARGWMDRFRGEYGGLVAGDEVRWLGLQTAIAGESHTGRAAPGFGELGETRKGAVALGDERWVGAEAELSAALGEHLALMFAPGVTSERTRLDRFELVTGWGNWRLSAGRQPVGLVKSPAAGLVLSGRVALDRVSLGTERMRHLPGFLRVIGPVGAELVVSRLWNDERHERKPFLWGGTLSVQPFPRLGLAVHRAAMFGGRGYQEPFNLETVVDMLLGRVSNLGFENQIVSVEARYRLPTEQWAPLTAYLEWGSEDAAGAWWDVPGRVFGLETLAIPGLEALAIGAAYTDIAPHCCSNPPWYRHHAFYGAWAVHDRPLGHRLGGEGSEWLVYGSFDRPAEGYRIEAQLFRRERSGQNLYVPGREESGGAVLRASWRQRPGLELRGEGA